MNIFSKIKNGFLDIVGDAVGYAALAIDHGISTDKINSISKDYDNILDAIADGKFGYDQDYENLLKKYGKSFKNRKTNERRTNKRTNNEVDPYLEELKLCEDVFKYFSKVPESEIYKKPKSFKEKVENAEFVEAEIIS